MKDSTVFILLSVLVNLWTLFAVITGTPILISAFLCFTGAVLLGLGFYNLAKYN
jgi:hypothetical protein